MPAICQRTTNYPCIIYGLPAAKEGNTPQKVLDNRP